MLTNLSQNHFEGVHDMRTCFSGFCMTKVYIEGDSYCFVYFWRGGGGEGIMGEERKREREGGRERDLIIFISHSGPCLAPPESVIVLVIVTLFTSH